MRKSLGILGGLGPLASADFVLSIYEHNMGKTEQEAPAIVLYSDPGFPDRTEAFLQGREHLLMGPLETALAHLEACSVTRIAIACITIHHLLPWLSGNLRGRIISLVDILLDAVAANRQPALLLATNGTRQMRVLEQSEHWPEAAPYIVFPDDSDQQKLHQHIYQNIKANIRCEPLIAFFNGLGKKYGVQQWIAGCTELHRISREIFSRPGSPPAQIIDPLMILARDYKEYLKDDMPSYGRLSRSHRVANIGTQSVANSPTVV